MTRCGNFLKLLDLEHLLLLDMEKKNLYCAYLGMVSMLLSQLITALYLTHNLEAWPGPSLSVGSQCGEYGLRFLTTNPQS